MSEDPAQEQEEEWIRENHLAYAGLIAVALVMIQPFLTTTRRLDVSAKICVVSFAVAIPLLAALVLLARQEAFRGRATTSKMVNVAKAVAQGCAFAGIVAGFWHIIWIAGVATLAAAFVAVGVHSAGFYRLEREPPKHGKSDVAGVVAAVLIGLGEDEARSVAEARGMTVRVVQRDGQRLSRRSDRRSDRRSNQIDLTIEQGTVTATRVG